MRENEFEFTPVMKLVIESNHRPTVTEADIAFFGRVALLQFTTKIPQIRRGFDAELQAQYPGILNWMIEGYQRWRAEGLDLPPSMHAAQEAYRQEMSPVEDFFGGVLTVCTDREAGQEVEHLYGLSDVGG